MLENFKIINLKFSPQYTELVASWIYNEFGKDKPDKTLEFVIDRFKNRNIDKIPLSLIALADDVCVGVVSIFDNDLICKPELTPWLAGLYVMPEYRCKGVAEHLINEVLKICRNMRYDTIYLRTEHASEYYNKRGWKFVESTTDEYGQFTSVFKKEL